MNWDDNLTFEVYANIYICTSHITFVNMYNEQLPKLYGIVLYCMIMYTCRIVSSILNAQTQIAHTIVFVHTTIHTHNTYHTHHTQPPHTHTCTHNTMCMQDGYFPLYVASQEGHDRIVEMLLQAEATVDLQNKVVICQL